MQKNPFSLFFGRIPPEYIARHTETEYILNTFTLPPVTEQTFLITGVLGSGKTVTMTTVGQKIDEMDDWIVVKISPMGNILESLLSALANNTRIRKLCIDAKIELTFPFANITLEPNMIPRSTIESIDRILAVCQERNLNVLVLIDEISDSESMRRFSSALQIFITNNRPIYFVGTCLYEELEALRNAKNLTFLYRVPRIPLAPLSIAAMAGNYQRVFEISKDQAVEMAKFTKGYSYAFQVLGYYCWEFSDRTFQDEKILNAVDTRLAESAYDKMWSDLSETDRKVMRAIASQEGGRTKSIYESLGMSGNLFNQYRRRLKERGFLDVSQYGKISFSLPRFAKYIETYAI